MKQKKEINFLSKIYNYLPSAQQTAAALAIGTAIVTLASIGYNSTSETPIDIIGFQEQQRIGDELATEALQSAIKKTHTILESQKSQGILSNLWQGAKSSFESIKEGLKNKFLKTTGE